MEYSINQIIDYYSKSSFEFVNIIIMQNLPNQVDNSRKTASGVSGLVIPISGGANFSLNETKYLIKEDTILHAGSQMNIDIQPVKQQIWEYAVIHYKTLVEAPFDLKNEHFSMKVKQTALLKELVIKLFNYYSEPGSLSKLQAKVVFLELLREILLQSKKYYDDTNSSIIPKAINYIQENYTDSFRISELANLLKMERRRFSELFEQHVGMTPIQYLTEYRILMAKEHLRISEYSISEIAELVGYEDSFYFSRVFKKHVGMSPKQYQKYLKENHIFIE